MDEQYLRVELPPIVTGRVKKCEIKRFNCLQTEDVDNINLTKLYCKINWITLVGSEKNLVAPLF